MASPDLVIRRASAEDAAALASLHAEALPPGWPVSDFEKYARSDTAEIWCAFRAADLIGLCVFQVLPPEAEILTVSVAKSAWRTGVGSALLNFALDRLGERRVDRIFLEVGERNAPARRLYDRVGFTLFAHRKNYYRENGVFQDAMIMVSDTVR